MGYKLLLIFLLSVVLMVVQSNAFNGANGGDFTSEMYGDENLMESWAGRRQLASSQSYVSYNALFADHTPCQNRGQSYFNCRTGAKANAPPANSSKSNSPQANSPESNPPQANSPRVNPPQANSPKSDPPQADSPKSNPPQADSPASDPPQADSPESDLPQADSPESDLPQADSRESE